MELTQRVSTLHQRVHWVAALPTLPDGGRRCCPGSSASEGRALATRVVIERRDAQRADARREGRRRRRRHGVGGVIGVCTSMPSSPCVAVATTRFNADETETEDSVVALAAVEVFTSGVGLRRRGWSASLACRRASTRGRWREEDGEEGEPWAAPRAQIPKNCLKKMRKMYDSTSRGRRGRSRRRRASPPSPSRAARGRCAPARPRRLRGRCSRPPARSRA